MRDCLYVLDKNGRPVVEPDLVKWAAWMQSTDRRVGRTKLGNHVVSTVFLGLDHSFRLHGLPILWETMVFTDGDWIDHACDRCTGTREQAEAMHASMVERVQAVQAL